MRLNDWLAAQDNLTQTAFAELLNAEVNRLRQGRGLGPKHNPIRQQHVSDYCRGLKRPRDEDVVRAIFNLTGGQVTPNDSYDLPAFAKAPDDAGAGAHEEEKAP